MSPNSAGLPMVVPSTEICRQNTERRTSSRTGPVVAPYVAMRPPGRSRSTARAKVSPPTLSMTTSGPRPPVSARISFAQSWVR